MEDDALPDALLVAGLPLVYRFSFNTQYKPEHIRLAEVLIQLTDPTTGMNKVLSGTIRNARIDEYGLTAGIQFAAEQLTLVAALEQHGVPKATVAS